MFELVDAEKANYPVGLLCAVLEVSRSGFYAWKKRPSSKRSNANARLAVDIAAAHKRSGRRYGSPRVHRALRKSGIRASRKRVERVMRENGIVGRQKRRFRRTTDSKHGNPIAPNVVKRNFEPKAPNQLWAGDVTYIATSEGWAYLAVLLDLYSRRVVGWAIRSLVGQSAGTTIPIWHSPPSGVPSAVVPSYLPASCTTPTAAAPTPATSTARPLLPTR